MTVVRHKLLRPSPAGDVPYSLELRFRPSRARVLDGDPKAVVVPAEFAEDLPAGILNVDLAPTGPGWCWEIFRPYGKVESLREWVVVPEPVVDPERPGEFLPVDYPDLVRVDPATLEPSAEPSPLWWAELESAKATAADVEAARVAAAGSALEAGAARDDAVAAAGDAAGFAGDAAGSASVAVAAAGTARADATMASTAAGDAGLALTGAESARDATVAAAGGSEASATVASGAAVESAKNALEARQASDVIIEMTETGRLSTTALSATIGELSGPVIDSKVAPVLEAANQSAQSAATSEVAALDVVTRANSGEFKGDQGLPGNATMRVDTTVGKRVFITDGVTEHMISGDTGWRDVRGEFAAMNDLRYTPITLKIRRINETVYLEAVVSSPDNKFYPFVQLLNNIGSVAIGFRLAGNYNWPTNVAGANNIQIGTASTNARIQAQFYPDFQAVSGGGLRVVASWMTSDDWPTSNRAEPA